MRIEADVLILLTLLSAVVLVSYLVLPFIGYPGAGVVLGTPALVLDVAVVRDVRRDRGGGTGRTPPPGGGRGGGGSGVRQPRGPDRRPPALSASARPGGKRGRD